MTQLLANFKRLCAPSTKEFISIKSVKPVESVDILKSGLESGITEKDKYFKADGDGIVQKVKEDKNKVGLHIRDLTTHLLDNGR